MSEALHTKYRPANFDEVIGQDAVVSSLRKLIKRGGAHCFLLCGPSGTGKTTLARIVANELGVARTEVLEIDAATKTGVDDMRAVQEPLQYRPFGGGGRAVIIDECHALSKNAWQSLLKITEEPPAHVYWFFCTTEANKVPQTIKTRAASYTLKPLSERDLGDLYDEVCAAEKIDLPGDIGDLIIKEAGGSPRQMLQNLTVCMSAKSKKEAAELLRTALESDATIELCRFLVAGGSWAKAMAIVQKMEGQDPESIRLVVLNYMSKVAMGAKSNDNAGRALAVLDAFARPFDRAEGRAPLILAIGEIILS